MQEHTKHKQALTPALLAQQTPTQPHLAHTHSQTAHAIQALLEWLLRVLRVLREVTNKQLALLLARCVLRIQQPPRTQQHQSISACASLVFRVLLLVLVRCVSLASSRLVVYQLHVLIVLLVFLAHLGAYKHPHAPQCVLQTHSVSLAPSLHNCVPLSLSATLAVLLCLTVTVRVASHQQQQQQTTALHAQRVCTEHTKTLWGLSLARSVQTTQLRLSPLCLSHSVRVCLASLVTE